jgi:ferredoxin/flavodoxin
MTENISIWVYILFRQYCRKIIHRQGDMMANAIIYTFSGTGNTLIAAEMIKKEFEAKGIKADIYRVKNPFGEIPDPNGYDYAGFGYPIYAFNCPELFFNFIKYLPSAPGKKAFIFKTAGEPSHFNDASSHKLLSALKKKGFNAVLEQHLLMPYNIVFRYKDSLVKQMYLYTEALCSLLVKRFIAGERWIPRYRLRSRALSFLFRIQWPGARFNGRLYSVNKKKCSKCLLCVKNCPTGNIRFENGKIKFDFKCNMCMYCAMFCPKDAVNIGLLRFWKVTGAYDFKGILKDPDIPSDFISDKTKGYFRFFRGYFKRADAMLEKYGAKLPEA